MKTFRNYANYDPANFCEDLKGVYLSPTREASVPEREHENVSVNHLRNFFQKAFISIILLTGTRLSCINACVG